MGPIDLRIEVLLPSKRGGPSWGQRSKFRSQTQEGELTPSNAVLVAARYL